MKNPVNTGSPGTHSGTTQHEADSCSLAIHSLAIDANLRQVERFILNWRLMTDRPLILEDLEAVRENLLALSDDIWLSNDHNDPESLEAGVAFKRTYNVKLGAFDSLATELSTLVQQFTSVNLAAEEQTGGDSESENRRIIHELDREEPHSLDENFTYRRFAKCRKRPQGRVSSKWSHTTRSFRRLSLRAFTNMLRHH